MSKNSRFEVVYQEIGLKSEKTIYVDKETGVNYLLIASRFGGGLTPLLDTEGKPIITK
ncbi:MAG: xylan 1,4-beta-xylosidase [Erysipelotrichia bacterium]|nr:xylan 1,4-beta-xylosidase [Erysipelotrichia bacterium]NCC54348.1 xylan 1,4-beta-xylosidase [Erysipelotrichia bacterium]